MVLQIKSINYRVRVIYSFDVPSELGGLSEPKKKYAPQSKAQDL
jgi:hypothetical protein